jgi:hypothetical protein
VQGVDREDDAAEAQVPDHGRRGLDLCGRVPHLLMAEDQAGLRGEGAEHVGRGAVVQPVEAAPERLAVERDDAPPAGGAGLLAEVAGVAAESGLQVRRIEGLEHVAQGVDGRRPAQADAP